MGYESESGMYRVYHPQNDSIAVSRDLLIFENKINAMAKHPPVDFAGVFDDIDEKASTADARPIFEETEVLTPPKVTVPATSAPQIVSPILSPAASPSPTPYSTPAAVSPEVPPVAPPESPVRKIPPVEPSSRSERRGLRDQPPVSYKGMIARASSGVAPRSYAEAMRSKDSKKWEIAMDSEIQSIVKNDCWELIPLPKSKRKKIRIVGSRWAYRVKDGDLYKARFCAKGFTQRRGEDYDETYAPVAKYISIRTLFTLTAGRRFRTKKIHQMDVKTAFLCSTLKETIYIRQPEGFEVEGKEDWVYRLKRSLYGLKQSSRDWYRIIAPVLEDFGFI